MKGRTRKHRRQQTSRPAAPRSRAADGKASEIELKFGVPAAAWEALRQALMQKGARPDPMQAIYFDTPDQALRRAGMVLRIRREKKQWVQTFKAAGETQLERREDEVRLGPARPEGDVPAHVPALALQGHAAYVRAMLGQALQLADGEAWPQLLPAFELKVTRLACEVPHGRSKIEISLDEGDIVAGANKHGLRELELELVQGEPRDLIALARELRKQWGLWLQTTSKSERAWRLVNGELAGPPVHAGAIEFSAPPKAGEFSAAVLNDCMRQLTANAAEMAEGSEADEHIHQLRVGIRRVRTALRELPWLMADRRRFEAPLTEVFRALGERRDRGYVLRKIQPLVEAAGGKPLRVPPGFHEGGNLKELVRAAPFQDAMLGLLALTYEVRAVKGGGVRRTLRKRLGRLHRQVTREGRRFTRLAAQDQHAVRKRLKRLRYLTEFAGPLFEREHVDAYLHALKPAQDRLGEFNDEIMAQHLYEELVGSDPGARFGIDWLAARRKGEAKACRKALRALAKAPRFWPKDRA